MINWTSIDDLYVGEFKELARTINDLPDGVSLEEIWFTVKPNYARPDSDALIKKHITTVPTAAGQITDDGTDTAGGRICAWSLFLANADTEKLKARQGYVFDMWGKFSTITDPLVVESGILLPQHIVTKSRTS